jgi:hypothetical protein
MSDDETIALFEMARGHDRELLIEALGYTRGDSGVPFLRTALELSGRGTTHLRVSAMIALATRLGTEAVPDLVPLLSGGNLQTQPAALACIEMKDDGRASADVVGSLQRRLRAKGRANTFGYYEISGILRYAIRVGALHPVLVLLKEDRERLQPKDRKQLDRVWPPDKRSRYLEGRRPADGPDAAAFEDWFLKSAAQLTDEERLEFLEEDVAPVIARLRKRRQRTTQQS